MPTMRMERSEILPLPMVVVHLRLCSPKKYKKATPSTLAPVGLGILCDGGDR